MIADSISTLPAAHGSRRTPLFPTITIWAKRLTLALPLGLVACLNVHEDAGQESHPTPLAQESPRTVVAAPLSSEIDALEIAKTSPLADADPMEWKDMHNVFWLGDRILSGGEPLSREALDRLKEMGIRTILSVDGKAPDWQGAEDRGMRYVHIPIEYSGIDDEPLAQIAKTFREVEGPIYVHCYHGKHRGPAAAAVGRMVLDGIPREEALAEMYQWCGTASKYQGLFEEIAFTDIPTEAETAAMQFDFPKEREFQGIRAAMIPMTRRWDAIKDARKRDWQVDPAHPDLVLEQEAIKLGELLQVCAEMKDYHHEMPHSEQVITWFEEGAQGAANLARVLSQRDQYEQKGEDWRPLALDAYQAVAASCKECHLDYRD